MLSVLIISTLLSSSLAELGRQEESAPYQPSGWKPAGPAFRLPERNPQDSPVTFFTPPPPSNTFWTFGAPPVKNQAFPNFRPAQDSYSAAEQNYGAPQESYGPPPNQPAYTYGPPQQETTTPLIEITTKEQENATSTTTLTSNSTEASTEGSTEPTTDGNIDGDTDTVDAAEENKIRKENLRDGGKKVDEGAYYIYHPSGLLQRVVYSTNDDKNNMAFSAQLKYENVEPIRGPVFTYDPQTYVFKRLY